MTSGSQDVEDAGVFNPLSAVVFGRLPEPGRGLCDEELYSPEANVHSF